MLPYMVIVHRAQSMTFRVTRQFAFGVEP